MADDVLFRFLTVRVSSFAAMASQLVSCVPFRLVVVTCVTGVMLPEGAQLAEMVSA